MRSTSSLNLIYCLTAVCIGQRQFQDQYFDSPDFDLTLKDFWLRCREGCWELKCPVPKNTAGIQKDSQAEGLCSRYREITNVPEIKAELSEVMKERLAQTSGKIESDARMAACDALEDWLNGMRLGCFAKYTTERCSFSLEEEGQEGAVRVDLDQADFGYCVGEIEILVPDGGDIQTALQRIERTADKLGEESLMSHSYEKCSLPLALWPFKCLCFTCVP